MAELPTFERRVNEHGQEVYLPSQGWTFPAHEWAPALNAITASRTVGEQREALTAATMCVAGYTKCLWAKGETKASTRMGDDYSAVRVRIDSESGQARLGFVRTDLGTIAYQSPDERTRNPAFAVFDWTSPDSKKPHEVYSSPDKELGIVAAALGREVKYLLAENLHIQYPDYGILDMVGVKVASS